MQSHGELSQQTGCWKMMDRRGVVSDPGIAVVSECATYNPMGELGHGPVSPVTESVLHSFKRH